MIGRTLGQYRIERRLGAGGMGMVYAARDSRLERPVALKVIHEGLEDASLRERMWREARAAAALNHPAICQVFEIGEHDGQLFIVMEMLEGETLEDRIALGPLDFDDVLRIAGVLLDALEALHARDLVHRDIKPSNVFLTRDRRVKLLDFGLVRPVHERRPGSSDATALTQPGLGIGSPGYMSPEQVLGKALDPRSDLFSLAVVLHEAASGMRTFDGANAVEIMGAVLKQSPAPLRGSEGHHTLWRVLERALARSPEDRFASAAEMAAEIRALKGFSSQRLRPVPAAIMRLAVLPFRMLRSDPERDFLAPSLADALAMSLAGIRSLVVRSTVASARYSGAAPDLDEIARALDVNVVLVGTLLASGERCRVAAQLVEAPQGAVLWSDTVDVSSKDIFELQDMLTRKIVESLKLPLSARERGALGRDVPASPEAYELFLRANQLCSPEREPAVARDLYLRALEADPDFAPAWMRLGHCCRLLGKYTQSSRDTHYRRAEEAMKRAFELRPDFPAASLARAQLDLDMGRTEHAIESLIEVVERNPNDPAGFAGLVTAFRYAGLVDESFEAHRQVRRLSPEMRTSIVYTRMALGDFVGKEGEEDDIQRRYFALIADRQWSQAATLIHWEAGNKRALEALLGGDRAGVVRALDDDFPDPEGRFYRAMFLALADEAEASLRLLGQAVDKGFFCPPALRIRTLDSLRGDDRFRAIERAAEERHLRARAAYLARWSEVVQGAGKVAAS
jgi:non-specific serine/threonine protein kinase